MRLAFLFFLLLRSITCFAGSGFFSVQQIDGRWWLIDPDGKPFISKGVTSVSFWQDRIRDTNRSPLAETNTAKYGDENAWRDAAAKRLLGWGFNTLGAWSDEKLASVTGDNGAQLAYAPTLNFGERFVAEKSGGTQRAWLHGIFPDVFDDEFAKVVRRIAQERCAPAKNTRNLLGWFTDNELRWGRDWRGKDELLTMFLNMPAGAPGRAAAADVLFQRYHGDFERFNQVWKTTAWGWGGLADVEKFEAPYERRQELAPDQQTERAAQAEFIADCDAFLTRLAERYFSITRAAIKEVDPNHMNFGPRFAYPPPQPVVAAAARHLDAISFNCYHADPTHTVELYSAFRKPLIIGEFSFRAKDSGLPNTKGSGILVTTQTERAAAFERYVRAALATPFVVGYHWFEHADEPKEGRFDGENSNYGLVNIRDEPYKELTQKMAEINAQAEELHRAAAVSPGRR